MALSKQIATWWPLVVVVYLAGCAVLGFLPRFGPPDFRYTGSDPSHLVWNLGWPVATMILDPRSGLHVGPLGLILLPFQALGVLGLVALRILLGFRVARSRKRLAG